MGAGDNPTEAIEKQGAFVQQTLEKAFEHMRELAGMAQKSQTEALAAISKRAEQIFRRRKPCCNTGRRETCCARRRRRISFAVPDGAL